VEFRLKEKLL